MVKMRHKRQNEKYFGNILQSGQVIMWKADSRGRLQQTPLCSHPLQERVSQVVLRPALPVDPNK